MAPGITLKKQLFAKYGAGSIRHRPHIQNGDQLIWIKSKCVELNRDHS